MKSFVITLFATASLAAAVVDPPVSGMKACEYIQAQNTKVCYKTYSKVMDDFWKKTFCSDKKVNLGRDYFPTNALDYD